MTSYLNYKFEDTPEFIETFDEAPLWSASFGLLLLKHLELKPNIKVLDIGSGAGFPLIELAGRLGNSCTLYGLDPWKNANERAKKKITNYQLTNVTIHEGSAESIPFESNSIDLIVSNLGINNFDNPDIILKECYRVMKPKSKLAITTNLNGHWKEFYEIFETTLIEMGKSELVNKLKLHQEHRGNIISISKLISNNGLKVIRHYKETFDMNFLNGSSFLNHPFVKLGWLNSWKELLPLKDLNSIFLNLENNLNSFAEKSEILKLTVPMAYIEAEKIK